MQNPKRDLSEVQSQHKVLRAAIKLMRSYRANGRSALRAEILSNTEAFANAHVPFSAAKAVLKKHRKFLLTVDWAGYILDEATKRLETELLVLAGSDAYCCDECGALIRRPVKTCTECGFENKPDEEAGNYAV